MSCNVHIEPVLCHMMVSYVGAHVMCGQWSAGQWLVACCNLHAQQQLQRAAWMTSPDGPRQVKCLISGIVSGPIITRHNTYCGGC